MTLRTVAAAFAASILAIPALAGDPAITIEDAYARASRPNAPTGAAFMTITNTGDADDRLIAVASDVAARVELHTNVMESGGVMRMTPIEGGIAIPAGESHALERGGDHVMFMGVSKPFVDGGAVTVTLTFESAGDITVEIPIDNDR